MLFMHRKHITLYTVKKKILVNNYKYVWNMAAMTFFTLYCYFFPFIIIYCQYIAVTHYSVIYYCNTFTFPSNKLCKGLQFQNQLLYHVAQCCCIARAQFVFFSTAGCLMMVWTCGRSEPVKSPASKKAESWRMRKRRVSQWVCLSQTCKEHRGLLQTLCERKKKCFQLWKITKCKWLRHLIRQNSNVAIWGDYCRRSDVHWGLTTEAGFQSRTLLWTYVKWARCEEARCCYIIEMLSRLK